MKLLQRIPLFALLTRREAGLLGLLLALALLSCLAPALSPEWGGGTMFIDHRAWHGLPNAADVLSNLPFLLMGAWGLWVLRGVRGAPGSARLFFWGLILTWAGSSFFHWQPDALRLVADRAGMTVAFAGMIGLAVSERVSARMGSPVAVFVLVAGLLAAHTASRNLLPWAVLQFGGMALIVVLAWVRPVAGAWEVRLGSVIFFYALAKLFELGDAWVFDATRDLMSGHTLKHAVAALAAWPVINAALRHNRPAIKS